MGDSPFPSVVKNEIAQQDQGLYIGLPTRRRETTHKTTYLLILYVKDAFERQLAMQGPIRRGTSELETIIYY